MATVDRAKAVRLGVLAVVAVGIVDECTVDPGGRQVLECAALVAAAPVPLVRMGLQVGPVGVEAPEAQFLKAISEARLDLALDPVVPVPSLVEMGQGPLKEVGDRGAGYEG